MVRGPYGKIGVDVNVKMYVSGTDCEGINWLKLAHDRVKHLGFSEDSNQSWVS